MQDLSLRLSPEQLLSACQGALIHDFHGEIAAWIAAPQLCEVNAPDVTTPQLLQEAEALQAQSFAFSAVCGLDRFPPGVVVRLMRLAYGRHEAPVHTVIAQVALLRASATLAVVAALAALAAKGLLGGT